MSLLSTGTVRGDKVVFCQNFVSRRMISDASGVLVGCSVGLRGPGIIPTAITSRVIYDRTQSLLINATQATWRVKFRTGATNNATWRSLLGKTPRAVNDNQWHLNFNVNYGMVMYIASVFNDLANYITFNASIPTSTETVLHFVFNGALAPGSRLLGYRDGTLAAITTWGAIPAAMRAGGSQVSIFNLPGGTVDAPDTDVVLRDFCLWNTALSAQECLDDSLNRTFQVTT